MQTTKIDIETPLKALPAYFGGKRDLIHAITSVILEADVKQKSIVDPMGGSMAIPVAMKHLGFEVHTNDRLYGPYVLGRGLVQNNEFIIDVDCIDQLICSPKKNKKTFIDDTYGGIHLPHELAITCDSIYSNIQKMPLEERWIYLVLLYRFLTFMAPYQQYRYKALVPQFYAGTHFKSMNHHIKRWNENIDDPTTTLIKFANQINGAVCHGVGTVDNLDVFKFLDSYKKSKKGVLYLDPPYAGATIPYEKGYGVADSMIRGEVLVPPISVFNNKKTEKQALEDLLKYARGYELTIFSYWSKLHGVEWFEQLFRDCGLQYEQIAISHTYKYSTKLGVSNADAGKRTTWSGDRRTEAGKQEILYKLWC